MFPIWGLKKKSAIEFIVCTLKVISLNAKGGLISAGIVTLVPLPKKGAKAENLNKLITVKGGKFKLSAQGSVHLLLAIVPKSKYFLKLSYLYYIQEITNDRST